MSQQGLVSVMGCNTLHSHNWGILLLLLSVIATLVTTVMLTIDFSVIGEMRSHASSWSDGDFEVAFGNYLWTQMCWTRALRLRDE